MTARHGSSSKNSKTLVYFFNPLEMCAMRIFSLLVALVLFAAPVAAAQPDQSKPDQTEEAKPDQAKTEAKPDQTTGRKLVRNLRIRRSAR